MGLARGRLVSCGQSVFSARVSSIAASEYMRTVYLHVLRY